MKFYRILLFILMIISLSFLTSCDNEDPEVVRNPNAPDFSCKIDGSLWEADTVFYSVMTELPFGNELVKKYYFLRGRSIDGSRIEFLITDYEENSMDPCVEAIDYYGKEHPAYLQGKSIIRDTNVLLTQCLIKYFPPVFEDADDLYFGKNSTIES